MDNDELRSAKSTRLEKGRTAIIGVMVVLAVLTGLLFQNIALAAWSPSANVTEVHTDNFTASVNITGSVAITDNVSIEIVSIPTVDVGAEDIAEAIDDALAIVVPLVLVLMLQVLAVWDKYPGDYYIAGIAMLFYGMTQITTLSWLSTLFILVGIYDFYKAHYRK